MAFSRIADVDRKILRTVALKGQMVADGWAETLIPSTILFELNIVHEWERSKSRYHPRTVIYAPVWVFGIQYNVTTAKSWVNGWEAVKPLLVATRDSAQEQEMVCAELSLDGNVARSVREAARNYITLLHESAKNSAETHV
jgi:hypothetical protein